MMGNRRGDGGENRNATFEEKTFPTSCVSGSWAGQRPEYILFSSAKQNCITQSWLIVASKKYLWSCGSAVLSVADAIREWSAGVTK